MRGIQKDAHEWLRFTVAALRDHDASWPTSLDANEGMSDDDLKARASIRARWEDKRALVAADVRTAAGVLGIPVTADGYPDIALAPEDAMPAFSAGAAQAADGTLRFKQILVARAADVTDAIDPETLYLLALDVNGKLYHGYHDMSSFDAIFWPVRAYVGGKPDV